ncbi:MAG: dockerin type I repeat-containing protein [Oscillospiraceae bacterium]|nr:dockerin type I repeat-containing protein [Oscillospiraceae bacterium]
MRHKATKRVLSLLLAMVMLVGLLPTATIPVFAEETTYTKAGEVGAVTAECEAFTEPELGAEIDGYFYFTVTSPADQRVSITSGYSAYWEKLSYGLWEKYTEAAFNEGTYRLRLTMNSFALSDGSYYALSSSTTLTLNDVSFTAGKLYDHYDSQGQGSLIFYSPEYTVTKEAGTYLVTVTAGSNGLASADKVYGKTGEVVTLTAQPYDGYRLKEWRVLSGGVTVENNRFTIGSEDVEIKAIFESSNENQGNITQVEVATKEGIDYRPVMGRTPERIFVTIQSSTPSDDTLGVGGYGYGRWQVKQPDGSWEYCMDEPFTYGTYRMCISLDNKVVDGTYYALTKDTVLIVDGEAWTADPYSYVNYYGDPNGRGEISFNSPEMDVIPLANVSDSTHVGCYVVPTLGEFAVPLGDDFSFTVEPKDYYELTNPDALKVYVNDILVTPDEDGVYTVENVTENLDIYCDGSGFTGYSNFVISANGKTVTEKVYVGDTYTFKTLAEFGATVPENSTFTGWKIGNKTYQPGETYTVPGGGEIKINAAFTGLHNITVENGKAYADEAHTIPISAAAEDQVIYIVADPAPEGKVFGYWTEIEISSPGGDGWFGSYDSAETTYTVYYSDVVLAPVYETPIDHIVINGMTKPSAGVAIDNSDYSYKWGCSVPANSGYSLGICYWYDITDGEPELAMSDGDVFQIGHTYRFKAKINLYGDTILAAKEDISVALTGLDAESYTWTISEYSQIYENMVIYFEFTCEREMPDTSVERPLGSGTAGDPFKISTVGELYWFTGFTNNYVAVGEDFAVERNKAHATLMNDIIVNPELLTDSYGLNASSSLLADWSPICASKDSPYCGTFDGQGYSISGLYYNTNGYQYEAYGFIARLGENGAVKNLTLKDTYFFRVYTGNVTPYAAGIVAFAPEASNRIENCHFDGVAGTKSDNFGGIAGGIVATNSGTIKDCTVRGRVIGRDSYSGDNGKAGGIAGQAYVTAMISDCTNYAEVLCMDSGPGVGYAGGIAGYLAGTVKDCSNWGFIHMYNHNNYTYAGGIVGAASGTAEQRAVISRCFNEASFTGSGGSGIVDYIYNGYVTVKNCYNTGSVTNGIVGIAKGAGISITYCHNVGITTKPIIDSIINADDIEMKNCYYVETSHYDTDRVEMTDAMLAEEFADGTVLALLDNGHWTQGEDDEYPVLGEIPGVTISGMVTSFGEESEKTTVQLFPSGSGTPAFSVTLTGTHAMYSFNGVEAGTYTMKVSKANHVTREYTVVVGNSPIPLDVKILMHGDADGDGVITANDAGLILQSVAGWEVTVDTSAADVDGDGVITANDAGLILQYVAGWDVTLS